MIIEKGKIGERPFVHFPVGESQNSESVNSQCLVRNGCCLATSINSSLCPTLDADRRFGNIVYCTCVTNLLLQYLYHSDLQVLETWW